MRYGRLHYFMLAGLLVGALGAGGAHAGPLAVIANYTDPGTATRPPTGWPPGSVAIIDTATDKEVGPRLTVGANPGAVAITPDGTTAVIACTQDSEIDFIDLTAAPASTSRSPSTIRRCRPCWTRGRSGQGESRRSGARAFMGYPGAWLQGNRGL